MKTITITKELYQFDELDQAAQDYAIRMFIDEPIGCKTRTQEDREIAYRHAATVLWHSTYWYDKYGVRQQGY